MTDTIEYRNGPVDIPTPADSEIKKEDDLEAAADPRPVNADKLARKLSARQVQMIAIGGTIGTGLFLGTGKALATGGPGSMLIAYAIVGAIVFITMLSLGEMAAFVPIAGSFCTFAGYSCSVQKRLIGRLARVLAKSAENRNDHRALLSRPIILAAAEKRVLIRYSLSLESRSIAAETPTTVTSAAITGSSAMRLLWVGLVALHLSSSPPPLHVSECEDGGTESIAITAGETKDPARTMPKVVRNVFWRILLFYLLSVLILGLNVPYTTPDLDSQDTRTSPFTLVFQMAGSTAAGSFINAVIMTSVLSAGNHALFAGTRLLYTLAVDRHAPMFFSTLNRNQVPWIAALATSAISILCFGASFIGAGQLWTWLQK
ncbi:MAG: hypothetical protein Q9188_005358 [Gyalolechia gomerana]